MKSHSNAPSTRSASAFGRCSLLATALADVLWGGLTAQATTYSWNTGSESDFGTAANWTPTTPWPPGTADTFQLGVAAVPSGTIDFTSSDSYTLNTLSIGTVSGTTAFNMSGGTLTINKSGTDGFDLGKANGANATFTLSGGTFSVIRPATYYQDCVSPGNAAGSTGIINLNGGTASFICGVEMGYNGTGTITINGANVYGTGWWDAGRGSNSGNTSQNQGSGTFNLMSGSLWLQQTNSGVGTKGLMIQQTALTGTANISGGTLVCEGIRVMNANSLAAGATPPTATLNVSGGDLWLGVTGMQRPGSLASGVATVNLSGGTFHTTNSLSPGGDVDWTWNANLPATITSGSVAFAPGIGRTITLSNVFSGTGGLAVAGPGKVDLEGANAYTGDTTLVGGTLSGSGSIQGNVIAGPGATIAPGSVILPATLTLSYNNLTLNATTNLIKLSTDPYSIGAGANDLVSTLGSLTLQNVTTIKVVPLGPLSLAYPYTVLQYGGAPLTAGDAAHFHVTSDSARYSFGIVDPSTTYPYLQITVTGNAANLLWRGGTAPSPNAWDHTTANWFNTGSSAADVFYNGDATVFDDTATVSSVVVVGTEQPSGITLSNNTKAFTFSGNGLLTSALDLEGTNSLTLALSTAPVFTGITANSGTLIFNLSNGVVNALSAPISDNGFGLGTIIQGGTNTLSLSGNNSSFNGVLIVTNGVLQYTAASALGAIGVSLFATNGGTLDFHHVNLLTKPVVAAGAGYNGMGALTDSGTGLGVNTVVQSITLAGDTTFGAVGRWEQPNGANTFNGNGFNLTVVGNGVILLNGDGETGLGNVHVTGSRLGFENTITLGDPTKTLTVESNALVTFYAVGGTMNKHLVLNNDALIDSGGAANTFGGDVLLAGTNFFATRSDLHLSGPVTGTGGYAVETNSSVGGGNGTLYLEAANTYSGPTVLSQGSTIKVGASSSLGSSSNVTLNAYSKLDVSSQTTFAFGNAQTLAGVGTVAGQGISFGSGSTLSVGTSASAVGTLTMNADATFQAGSTNRFKVNPGSVTSDQLTGLNSVTYGGTLVVTKIGASAFAAGNVFHLFTATTYNPSSFASISLPPLPAALGWDTTGLTVDGSIKVVSRPQFSSITPLGDGSMQLTFTGNVGVQYTLWATTNVAKPLGQWQNLGSANLSTSPLTIHDATATSYSNRFYTITQP